MKKSDLLLLAVLGAVGYWAFSKAKGALSSATLPVSTGIANLWVQLTSSAPLQVPGNVLFPDGTGAPVSTLTIKTDAAGNVYTQMYGHVYQLQPSDPVTGDWPAILVQ